MKVLVLNCGSSSIKYQMFDMPARTLLAKGMVERIGDTRPSLVHQENGERQQQAIDATNHDQAMDVILQQLMHRDRAGDDESIGAVGHRVVHGGEEFTGSVLIDDAVLASIE